jgi:hypothetical protein
VAAEAAVRRPAPRVWVLVGGDGSQRQRAFRSGANVAAKLARCCDIQVCYCERHTMTNCTLSAA